MSEENKNRLLELYKILANYTDEQHKISMREIISQMEGEGYPCSEDSVKRYINQLKNELDIDIVSSRGRNAGYFLGERLVGKEELRLIIDAINTSNFIEKKIANQMIDRLKSTMSIYERKELDRTTLGVSSAKTDNTKVLYNVNKIQEALIEGVRINFDYMTWDKNKKLKKKSEKRYSMNPWALIWAYDRYYLYGFDIEQKDGDWNERTYRVDKLDNIELTDIRREGVEKHSTFNADTFVPRRVGMFSGKESMIALKVPEYLVGAFLDQFGKDIVINDDTEGYLEIKLLAVPSTVFLGWLIGLGGVKIISPESVKVEMENLLKRNMDLYKEDS